MPLPKTATTRATSAVGEKFLLFTNLFIPMKSRIFLGGDIKKGKFNPDEFFNPQLIEDDKSVFCLKFINTMDQIKLLNSDNARYVVCDNDLYVYVGENE